jgi:hypothetical protein
MADLRLSRQVSFVTTWELPSWSTGPTGDVDVFAASFDAGYVGMQVFFPDHAEATLAVGMSTTSGIGPARSIAEVDGMLGMWADSPADSVTLHLGSGFESRPEGLALVEHALTVAGTLGIDLLVETHRATLFQDPARALDFVAEFPELRFTADLSHWYTGVEMVYGDFDAKIEALQPVFDRCRMIHGRISDPGCIQVAVTADDQAEHVAHFRQMWRAVRDGCASTEVETLPFVVELLPASTHYARQVDRGNGLEEEVDRWTQGDVLWQIFSSIDEDGGHDDR